MEQVVFTQTVTEPELRREVETWYRLFAGRTFMIWVGLAAIVGGAAWNLWRGGGVKPMAVLGFAAVMFFVYMFFLHRKLAVNPVFNALKRTAEFGCPALISISPAGTVRRECAGRSAEFPLAMFARAAEVDHGVMLFISKSGWISLKREGFPDEAAYRRFLHNVELNRIVVEDCRHDGKP